MRGISLAIEGVGHFAHAFPALVTKAVFEVSAQEQVRMEVCCGLCTHPQMESLHGVGTQHRVHGTDIHLAGTVGTDACLHIVLYESLSQPEQWLEAPSGIELVQEQAHIVLGACERFGTGSLPEHAVAQL